MRIIYEYTKSYLRNSGFVSPLADPAPEGKGGGMYSLESYIQAGRGLNLGEGWKVTHNYFNVDLEVDETHLDVDTDPALERAKVQPPPGRSLDVQLHKSYIQAGLKSLTRPRLLQCIFGCRMWMLFLLLGEKVHSLVAGMCTSQNYIQAGRRFKSYSTAIADFSKPCLPLPSALIITW